MNSERSAVSSESPQLPPHQLPPPQQLPPHQLPPHQLLGLAGLVAGAGMGSNMTNNMNLATSSNTMGNNIPSSTPGSDIPRNIPATSAGGVGVGNLVAGVSGPPRPPPLPPGILNMDNSGGMGWGGWADLQESMAMERGRSRNWTYEETVELINLYTSDEWQTKFSSEKKNHRAIWSSLAAALTRRKDVSGDEARQRLNNLKALYNRTRRQLLAGEISSPQWEYWEPLHAFLGRPQPYIPITTTPTTVRPGISLPGFPQTPPYQPYGHHHHHHHHPHGNHQGLFGALGLSPPMHHHPRNMTPRPMFKQQSSPDVMLSGLDDDVRETGVIGSESQSNAEYGSNSGEEVPIAVSPEHILPEAAEHEPTPPPPTPPPQKPESYQLRHNNHLTIVLEALARDEAFMDVTLTAQGRSLKAHKSVLSAVSPYFRGVLRDNPCQHPIIIMPRDVRFEELYSIVNYIYKGEMTVAAEDLTSLLKTAEILQVSGLAPSDSSATVNPQTDTTTTGNIRSSSASSSSSSSNMPSTSRGGPSRVVRAAGQDYATPPTRPKSRDSSINPTDYMDVDMTCVKEEVASGGEEEDHELSGVGCSSQPPVNSTLKVDQQQQDLQTPPAFDTSQEQDHPHPLPSTSSYHDSDQASHIKSDPDTELSRVDSATDDPAPHMCPHCEEQHRGVEAMTSHLRLKHPSKPSFPCGCGRVFIRQMYYQTHQRSCPSSS